MKKVKSNHYSAFVIYTYKVNLVLLERKGDDRDNDDSRDKNRLGKKWAEKARDNYRYLWFFKPKEWKIPTLLKA